MRSRSACRRRPPGCRPRPSTIRWRTPRRRPSATSRVASGRSCISASTSVRASLAIEPSRKCAASVSHPPPAGKAPGHGPQTDPGRSAACRSPGGRRGRPGPAEPGPAGARTSREARGRSGTTATPTARDATGAMRRESPSDPRAAPGTRPSPPRCRRCRTAGSPTLGSAARSTSASARARRLALPGAAVAPGRSAPAPCALLIDRTVQPQQLHAHLHTVTHGGRARRSRRPGGRRATPTARRTEWWCRSGRAGSAAASITEPTTSW